MGVHFWLHSAPRNLASKCSSLFTALRYDGTMSVVAPFQFAVAPEIVGRWSPRVFTDASISRGTLAQVFEAGRWAPSCFNEQPWRFIVGIEGEGAAGQNHQDILSCLVTANQEWAGKAPVLFLGLATKTFARNDKPNAHARHDLGLALGQMGVQASALGLGMHLMAGFDGEKARELFGVPSNLDVVVAAAVGVFPGEAPGSRPRAPQSEFVYVDSRPADLADGTPGGFGQDVVPSEARQLLSFWCGDLDDNGMAAPDLAARWYAKDPAFDATVRDRFGKLHAAAVQGKLEAWKSSALGRVAYIILLDQFSRNLGRDAVAMFAGDARALSATKEGRTLQLDAGLALDHRVFFLMPLMHSESLQDQDDCVAAFESLATETSGPGDERVNLYVKYAKAHRDIIKQFGRFPHRNQALGRTSTPDEEAFLKTPGSGF